MFETMLLKNNKTTMKPLNPSPDSSENPFVSLDNYREKQKIVTYSGK